MHMLRVMMNGARTIHSVCRTVSELNCNVEQLGLGQRDIWQMLAGYIADLIVLVVIHEHTS